MNTLSRNKKTIYLCKHYEDSGIIKFKKPEEIDINITPVSIYSQINPQGKYYGVDLLGVSTIEIGKKFSAGDKCYINQIPPKTHDVLCKQADFIVDRMPGTTINSTEIRFKRLSGASNVN